LDWHTIKLGSVGKDSTHMRVLLVSDMSVHYCICF
jgi:hypothetical protein